MECLSIKRDLQFVSPWLWEQQGSLCPLLRGAPDMELHCTPLSYLRHLVLTTVMKTENLPNTRFVVYSFESKATVHPSHVFAIPQTRSEGSQLFWLLLYLALGRSTNGTVFQRCIQGASEPSWVLFLLAAASPNSTCEEVPCHVTPFQCSTINFRDETAGNQRYRPNGV